MVHGPPSLSQLKLTGLVFFFGKVVRQMEEHVGVRSPSLRDLADSSYVAQGSPFPFHNGQITFKLSNHLLKIGISPLVHGIEATSTPALGTTPPEGAAVGQSSLTCLAQMTLRSSWTTWRQLSTEIEKVLPDQLSWGQMIQLRDVGN